MDKVLNRKSEKPKTTRNMEAQKKNKLEATKSNTKDSGCRVKTVVQEDKLTKLMKENALLRDQLTDSQFKEHRSDRRRVAAERNVAQLKTQLEAASRDLINSENKVASLILKMNMAKADQKRRSANASSVSAATQCTKASQTEERDISELTLQLQKAHEDLEKCTAKLQSSADCPEVAEHEQHEKVQALKTGIMDLSVKLQKEQVALMKKAIAIVPCHTEDECTSQKTQSAQIEEVEKVNLQLQKLHMNLLQQALSLKTVVKEKKAPTRYEWYRTHRDQEQQTDQLETAEQRATDAALSELHKDKDLLQFQIQQLKEKLDAEEALRIKNEKMALELEAELQKKTLVVEEAQSKVGLMEKDLLKVKVEAREEMEKTRASYVAQLEDLKKMNQELAATQKKAEEQLQNKLKQWQDERASLQKAIERLQQSLKEKQQEWTERERDMGSRMDDLESRMKEMLEKKSKKKKGWLARHFTCSSSK